MGSHRNSQYCLEAARYSCKPVQATEQTVGFLVILLLYLWSSPSIVGQSNYWLHKRPSVLPRSYRWQLLHVPNLKTYLLYEHTQIHIYICIFICICVYIYTLIWLFQIKLVISPGGVVGRARLTSCVDISEYVSLVAQLPIGLHGVCVLAWRWIGTRHYLMQWWLWFTRV